MAPPDPWKMLQAIGARQARERQGWASLLNDLVGQLAEKETAIRDLLTLCAESPDGTVRVERIYETLGGWRQ